ncbi:MAG: SDR family NAD(P)-dependent oxidoreductase [Planctomycetaceae bacterium]|jgi:short-subunit dehydrogenase|nr:SDR family NAD(P)-dependent oxidoreductase [Planctomycetaceae bacterium]
MKKAIVIGATSGIGRELAMLLADDGYCVGITGRRVELLDELKTVKENFIVKAFDVTKTESVVENLEQLVTELGGLDLLIISAGTGNLNGNFDFALEQPAITTNVVGFTRVCDWALHFFEQQKYGHLVAISSIAGLRGSRIAPAYNASKAYQINYLEAARQKTASLKLPIFITDIRPGLVDTAMAKGNGLFWVAPAKKAAKQIIKAISKKKKVAYVTKRWRLLAILLQLLPKMIYDKF